MHALIIASTYQPLTIGAEGYCAYPCVMAA